jgi:hypothetical protein
VPAGPEDLAAGASEEAVIDDQADGRGRIQQPGDDQIAHQQAERIDRPARGREEAVRTRVMPHAGQPCPG